MVLTVLGVDPSIKNLGYSIVTFDKKTNDLKCHEASVLRLKSSVDIHTRLHIIYKHLEEIIRQYKVNTVGVETAFINHKYPSACLSLSQVRGVVLLLSAENNCELINVAPAEAKKLTTTSGNANKRLVQNMCNSIFNTGIKSHDASDAVAIALSAVFKNVNL